MKHLMLIGVLVMGTAHAIKYDTIYEQDLSAPAIKITQDDAGNWVEITTSQWQDTVQSDEGQKSFIYQLSFNYVEKTGYLRTYTTDMALVSEVKHPDGGGMASREEIMRSFEIFKQHPDIIKVLQQEQEPIKLFGGFGYADDEPGQSCYQGQRCVHVFAHTESKALVAHAIVKLSDQSVPYPDFDGLYNKKEE
ncbi:hypothetical protein [Marinicella meishanensis]|uniref:hypothetical protein n=1 Tax=Marinicella meishanensis TaxID=2873263 RepID=UPI001CBFC813|nr:hypothetical protein [Marinicella sp. NBU2979]